MIFGILATLEAFVLASMLDAAFCSNKANVPSRNPAIDAVNGLAGGTMDTGCKMLPWR